MRRYLFLDFDGVLNSAPYCTEAAWRGEEAVDPSAVARLQHILDATGATVVYSTSWRHSWSAEDLTALLLRRGLRPFDCGGKTPIMAEAVGRVWTSKQRGEEILTWLELQGVTYELGQPVDDWWSGGVCEVLLPDDVRVCILDDNNDMLGMMPYLVQTDFDHGLQDEHVERAIAMLS